ncbi:MAG: hypothetical protein K6B68_10985 [Eubacterium sp.]|nr:hypothetical protein [Eubacterium sp.]
MIFRIFKEWDGNEGEENRQMFKSGMMILPFALSGLLYYTNNSDLRYVMWFDIIDKYAHATQKGGFALMSNQAANAKEAFNSLITGIANLLVALIL